LKQSPIHKTGRNFGYEFDSSFGRCGERMDSMRGVCGKSLLVGRFGAVLDGVGKLDEWNAVSR
jgi:hypothetical protein